MSGKVRRFRITINGRSYDVEVVEIGESEKSSVKVSTSTTPIPKIEKPSEKKPLDKGVITSPLPGKVLSVKVKVGDNIKRGDCLIVLDSMKMENEILAPKAGVVKEIKVSVGSSVNSGDPLMVIE